MINISDRLQVNKLIKYFLPKWFLARTNKNICHITYDGTYFPGQFLLPFCRAMPCNRGLCRYTVSVCLSVCHVRELSKWINISSIFYTILVFPYQTSWQYSDGDPPNGGVERRWGRRFSAKNLAPSRAVNGLTAKCNTLGCNEPWQVVDASRW